MLSSMQRARVLRGERPAWRICWRMKFITHQDSLRGPSTTWKVDLPFIIKDCCFCFFKNINAMLWIKHNLHYNYFFLLFNSLKTSLVSKDEKLVIKVSINSNHIKSSPYRDSLITNPKLAGFLSTFFWIGMISKLLLRIISRNIFSELEWYWWHWQRTALEHKGILRPLF